MPQKQRHRIKQQRIELTLNRSLAKETTAVQQLQDRISQLCQSALLNHLEQQFDNLSNPNELYRIERLEIDLGNIAINNLEHNFIQRFQQCLTQALTSKDWQKTTTTQKSAPQDRHTIKNKTTATNPLVGTTNQPSTKSSNNASAIELWHYFLHHGYLPWWVDNKQHDLLSQALTSCLAADTHSFNALWQTVISEQSTLKRFLAHSHTQQSLLFIQRCLTQTNTSFDNQTVQSFLQTFLAKLTTNQQNQLVQQWLLLLKETQNIANANNSDPLLSALFSALQDIQQQLSTQHSHYIDNKNTINPKKAVGWAEARSPTINHLDTQNVGLPASAQPTQNNNSLNNSFPRSSVGMHTKTLQRHDHHQAQQNQPIHAHTNTMQTQHNSLQTEQECYVHNAGLVILWPFLTPFFQTLGLLTKEKQFAQLDDAYHAMQLLHHLSHTDDNEPSPEYQLMLNKILCGVDLESVFETDRVISEKEQQECQHLLEAVIHHASILNNMSIQGFQGSFLLRQGILRQRDGLWLLQVEQQSYDVVLDRFPWRFNMIKLPWMESPLQVEW